MRPSRAKKTLADGYKWFDGTTADKEISWSIAPASITEATAASQEWTGSELTPVLTVKAGDLTLASTDYEITAWSGELKNFGSYSATVTGTGNFAGTKEVTFNITHDPHSAERQEGKPATETEAGYKEYYVCACGGIFEDEDCTVLIEDLDAWKAEGGRGYIKPLKAYHTIFYNGDEQIIFEKDLTESATEGETVTFAFKVKNRYEVKSIMVKTAKGEFVHTQAYNGKYSFVMPDEDVIVTVTSVKEVVTPVIITVHSNETNPQTGAPVETAPFVVLTAVLAAVCFVCRKRKETN